ncbi:MAG: flavodoxin-dependent (E)-4-hydroxy-3-methylbut-2-enyl-diphosphate synthase [Oscillospiraceae bacterium]|jgi:(E)-4-hydroxy-3-methylbut-2-enyl-diphosphate synthase|nr:flavodoxin-dependent (E)-4-hydroxy-3-methylbut-2-enyl-diphosphate synthase [Oscillospiraceae bacterium]
MRRSSKTVKVGNTYIGGDSPISVQSMLNVPPHNTQENINQALELEKCGCDIIRVSVPTMESIKNIYALKEKLKVPVVADIHFNHQLALESISAGADKIRINPGNIGSEENIKKIAKKCAENNVPIRVGINSGSLEKKVLQKYGKVTPEAMCESALHSVKLLEKYDFDNIVISIKSSNPSNTVFAYRLVSQKCDYPLHVGVTESGTETLGSIKSFAAIGSLLIDGIGDTIRISLTADPKKEVEAGINLLKSLNLCKNGIEFISCPTCARTKIDVIKIANQVEKFLSGCKKNLKVAVMGCAVNGPGEVKEADIGIAGGNGMGIIFKKGEVIKKVKEKDLVEELIKEIEKI